MDTRQTTEGWGAESVIVNLGHTLEVEDDVHGLYFRQRDDRGTQNGFRIGAYQASSQIENPNPILFALMELEIHGLCQGLTFPNVTSALLWHSPKSC